jgi:hypothetical protein
MHPTIKTPVLVDAQKMRADNPTTFWAPSGPLLSAIKVGDSVKVCAEDERFWTLVTEVNGDVITATVDNDLVHTRRHGLRLGDTITFAKLNAYDVIQN